MISQKYPYTDLHELNLDWLLTKMKELERHVDETYNELYNRLKNDLEEYVDEHMRAVLAEFEALKVDFRILTDQFEELDGKFDLYMADIENKINAINSRITNEIQAVNDRTDILIASNNEFLLSQMSEELRQLKVINFFNGELTSVQDMFNYLANLHLTDGIAYNQITARGYTYGSIEALNLTYGDIVMHGNTLLP